MYSLTGNVNVTVEGSYAGDAIGYASVSRANRKAAETKVNMTTDVDDDVDDDDVVDDRSRQHDDDVVDDDDDDEGDNDGDDAC